MAQNPPEIVVAPLAGPASPVEEGVGVPTKAVAEVARWSFQMVNRLGLPLVVDGDSVYATDAEGTLHALDATTGSERWRFEKRSGPFASLDVRAELVLYVTASMLHVLQPKDGRKLWQYTGGDGVFWATADARRVYAVRKEGFLVVLDRASGQVLWEFEARGPIHSRLVVDGETVWFGAGAGYVQAVDLVTQKEQWRHRVHPDKEIWLDDLADGVVYGWTIEPLGVAGEVFALAASTGDPVSVDGGADLGVGSWRGSERMLHAFSADGQYAWFERADEVLLTDLEENLLVRLGVPGLSTPSPAVAKDMMYLGTHDGVLWAVPMEAVRSFVAAAASSR